MRPLLRRVLRWGQSAYESDADLGLERDAATALGLGWSSAPESDAPPPLDGVGALVVTSRVRVTDAVLAQFPGDLVLTTTSGWDHIDVQAAVARGITVARCPLARRDAVAEQAVATLTLLLHRQPALNAAARAGEWARAELPALDPLLVADATVAVVGLGVIGRRVAELLAPTGARVLGVDPLGVPAGVHAASIDEAVAEADAVTLHCALNPTTRGLFDAARIARMRPGAVLVNTARGALVDVDAAVEAVRRGRLRGLHLDVFPREPWPDLAGIAAVPGVWTAPHAAGYARGLGAKVAREVAEALGAWVAGAPAPHAVTAPG